MKGLGKFDGFTLLEAIIYVAILGLIIVAVFEFAQLLQDTRVKFIARSIQHNGASHVLKKVNFLVRNSDGFVEDTDGNNCFSSTSLRLYFATSSLKFVPPGCMGSYASGVVGVTVSTTLSGVTLTCYRDYPSQGKASCDQYPSHTSSTSIDLIQSNVLYVGPPDLRFATTTVGERQAIETLISVGYIGPTINFNLATLTASSTAAFRVAP